MNRLSAISLFTGCGGLDFGFEAGGFDTRVAVEMDARCVETLKANRDWPVLARDISKVTTDELLAAGGLDVGAVDVLIGGPPCQPFSKAGFWATGTSKRLDDPRATTLDHYLRILEEAKPRAFLLENVEGLGFRGKDDGLKHIRDALVALNERAETNYRAHVAVLNAADFGVPQLRRRLFIIGARDGGQFSYPIARYAERPGDDGRERWRTTWDALWNLDDQSADALTVRGKWAALLPSIPEGQNYLWHTDRGGGEPLFGWRRRFWSFLLKLAKNQPSWTLAAQPGPATGPFHWTGRRLSMREMARLQTFPDDIEVLGSVLEVQRQIGNAVPSLLAEILAREIRSQLLRSPLAQPLELAVDLSSRPVPAAEPVKPVPEHYLELIGVHEAHPGTGKGPAALQRQEMLAAAE